MRLFLYRNKKKIDRCWRNIVDNTIRKSIVPRKHLFNIINKSGINKRGESWKIWNKKATVLTMTVRRGTNEFASMWKKWVCRGNARPGIRGHLLNYGWCFDKAGNGIGNVDRTIMSPVHRWSIPHRDFYVEIVNLCGTALSQLHHWSIADMQPLPLSFRRHFAPSFRPFGLKVLVPQMFGLYGSCSWLIKTVILNFVSKIVSRFTLRKILRPAVHTPKSITYRKLQIDSNQRHRTELYRRCRAPD